MMHCFHIQAVAKHRTCRARGCCKLLYMPLVDSVCRAAAAERQDLSLLCLYFTKGVGEHRDHGLDWFHAACRTYAAIEDRCHLPPLSSFAVAEDHFAVGQLRSSPREALDSHYLFGSADPNWHPAAVVLGPAPHGILCQQRPGGGAEAVPVPDGGAEAAVPVPGGGAAPAKKRVSFAAAVA